MDIIKPEQGFSIHDKISCVYKITNKKNDKVYIGQTNDFRKRISDYNNAQNKKDRRLINRIITEEGSDNFKIEIIGYPTENKSLIDLENYYIDLYDSCNPNKGYNIVKNNNPLQFNAISNMLKSKSHIGLKESAETKRKKSNTIIAIKDKELIVSDSGKLFGDYIGKTKDYIKNCLRQPSKVCGYRLYYDDYHKRQEIRNKMLNKRCIRDIEYMEILDLLDEIEKKGVETIYSYFDISFLQYNEDVEKEPILIKLGTDHFAG